MLNILSLPYEVFSIIVESLSFDDYYNLGRTCSRLRFLLEEERICKFVIQVNCHHPSPVMCSLSRAGQTPDFQLTIFMPRVKSHTPMKLVKL